MRRAALAGGGVVAILYGDTNRMHVQHFHKSFKIPAIRGPLRYIIADIYLKILPKLHMISVVSAPTGYNC